MAQMTAGEFIEVYFITQVGQVVDSIPYMAFMVMGIGIEFLGKCVHSAKITDRTGSRDRFEEAINTIPAFSKYKPLIGEKNPFDLYSSLRCGLAHAAVPKYEITITSKKEHPHMETDPSGKCMNLACEDFYADFRQACEEVLGMPDPVAKKLSSPFLEIPD
jgi:hypothetical protein